MRPAFLASRVLAPGPRRHRRLGPSSTSAARIACQSGSSSGMRALPPPPPELSSPCAIGGILPGGPARRPGVAGAAGRRAAAQAESGAAWGCAGRRRGASRPGAASGCCCPVPLTRAARAGWRRRLGQVRGQHHARRAQPTSSSGNQTPRGQTRRSGTVSPHRGLRRRGQVRARARAWSRKKRAKMARDQLSTITKQDSARAARPMMHAARAAARAAHVTARPAPA